MKKSILVVLAVFLLASSLAMVSCGDGGTGSNKFVGTWVTSSFNSNNTSLGPATLKFTSSEWALTVPGAGINEKGSYTFGSIDAYAYLNQNGSNIGQAIISNGLVTVHLSISGPLNGTVNQFTK